MGLFALRGLLPLSCRLGHPGGEDSKGYKGAQAIQASPGALITMLPVSHFTLSEWRR